MIVQKYGGSSLDSPEKIKAIARSIKSLKDSGEDVIVVVSAIGNTTNELMEMASHYSKRPVSRELDLLLSAGERMSMALMALSLNEIGCPAMSFTGSQAGIITDGQHNNASIIDIRPVRLPKEIEAGKVIVLAGFQGVSEISKDVTTLGRGGSDTTAVAMAAHFKAKRCEFLKDVAGVYTEDPKTNPQSLLLNQLSYGELREMCLWGAKVIHEKAVRLAEKKGVPMRVSQTLNASQEKFTSIGFDHYQGLPAVAKNSLECIFEVSTAAEIEKLSQAMSAPHAPQFDVLFANPQLIMVTCPTNSKVRAIDLFKEYQVAVSMKRCVSETYLGSNNPDQHKQISHDLGLTHTRVQFSK